MSMRRSATLSGGAGPSCGHVPCGRQPVTKMLASLEAGAILS